MKKWSMKYKKSIDCKHPKGFSQKQHCKYGRTRNRSDLRSIRVRKVPMSAKVFQTHRPTRELQF